MNDSPPPYSTSGLHGKDWQRKLALMLQGGWMMRRLVPEGACSNA